MDKVSFMWHLSGWWRTKLYKRGAYLPGERPRDDEAHQFPFTCADGAVKGNKKGQTLTSDTSEGGNLEKDG